MCVSPLVLALYPIGAAIYFTFEHVYILSKDCKIFKNSYSSKGCACIADYLIWLVFGLTIIFPVYLALGAVVAGLSVALGTIPLIYYGFAYIIRVSYNTLSA